MHVSTSTEFWDGMNEKFYRKYFALDKKHKEWMDIVSRGLPLIGPLGRQWSFTLKRDRYGNLKLPINQLVNYPVQGTGADIMTIARISAHKRIRAANLPCDFVSTVHDSIVVDTHEAYLQPIAKIFDEVFADLPKNIHKMFGYRWEVPMACESKYGPNMRDMSKLKV